jgi:hypothetical protein
MCGGLVNKVTDLLLQFPFATLQVYMCLGRLRSSLALQWNSGGVRE